MLCVEPVPKSGVSVTMASGGATFSNRFIIRGWPSVEFVHNRPDPEPELPDPTWIRIPMAIIN